MLINEELMQQPEKHHYLIIEKWGGIDARADYFRQAQAMRRALDAIEYIEQGFRDGLVGLGAALSGQAGTVVLACVDSPEQIGDFIKSNPANARVAPSDRIVMPMADWESGRAAFVKLIEQVQSLASEERELEAEGRVRPFAMTRPQ